MTLRGRVDSLRRTALTRFRRPLAAVLAACSVLVAVSALRSEPTPSPATAPVDPVAAPGEVLVPVPLANRTLATVVSAGDVVDLVTVDDDGQARVVAERARVVNPRSGASSAASGDALILVAVPAEAGLALTAALTTASVAVLIHPDAPQGT